MKLSTRFCCLTLTKSRLSRAARAKSAQISFSRSITTKSTINRISIMNQDSTIRRFLHRAGNAASTSGAVKTTMQLSSTILNDINKIVRTLTNSEMTLTGRQKIKILTFVKAPSVSRCFKRASEEYYKEWTNRICRWWSSYSGVLHS
jgi:hypothetical protein